MRHKVLKSMVGCAGLCGLLAGCATTVDMGGPLGHYRYSYDSRPTVYGDDTVYQGYTDDDQGCASRDDGWREDCGGQ